MISYHDKGRGGMLYNCIIIFKYLLTVVFSFVIILIKGGLNLFKKFIIYVHFSLDILSFVIPSFFNKILSNHSILHMYQDFYVFCVDITQFCNFKQFIFWHNLFYDILLFLNIVNQVLIKRFCKIIFKPLFDRHKQELESKKLFLILIMI